MEETLNITKLIEKTEQMVYDGKIDSAARGMIGVQEFTNNEGVKYQLQIIMTSIKDEFILIV